MKPTVDELAGVVDIFGGLRDEELRRAYEELAARTGAQSIETEVFDEVIERALKQYALVECAVADDSGYVAGPTAFPDPPTHAEDLPHILEVPHRSIDRERVGERVCERFCASVDEAITADDEQRARTLLDVSYDVEAWAPVELTDERTALEATLE